MNRNFKPIFDENGGIVNTEELKKNMLNHLLEKGFKCDLTNPKTIQDKLNWLSIYDVNNTKTLCADKLKIREYCSLKLGKDICVPLITSYKNTKDIDWESLPNSFVIKCNHGSGMNIIVKNKNLLDKNSCVKKLDNWLQTDFSMINNYELQYFNIPRCIVVEKLLADEKQVDSLIDYKFWCFNGEPKMYTLNTGNGHGDIRYFNMKDEPLNFYDTSSNNEVKKPYNFNIMLDYAKKLCGDFKFVRVDFYEVNDMVYLGELTFTPGANIFSYKKYENNLFVGNMLDIGHIRIIEPEILDENKPSCVVGVLTTENGKIIESELYDMLKLRYNVYKVEQAPPGKEFEYPAIKFAIDLCRTKKLKQILYLHTKGAVYSRSLSKQVRQGLWRQEFVDNADWYLAACDTDKPMVVCPATNNSGTTWYNGFFINSSACELVTLKKELRNRYYYEHIFCQPVNKKIKVIGRIFNDVAERVDAPSHKKLNDYIFNLPVVNNVSNVKNKRVIYTCITSGYETIMPLTHHQQGYDYVCFTDDSGQTSNFWELRSIPDELLNLSSVKQQRIIKICPHKYLSEYDESIWIDGAIDILSDINNFIETYCSDKNKSVFIRKHPCRNCIYEEGLECIRLKKDVPNNVNSQLNKYKQDGFPKNFGLVETNVIYRRHNDPYCVKLMETWANELMCCSHRDQLSFNYALWKIGGDGFKYLDFSLDRCEYFQWYNHHDRGRNLNCSYNTNIEHDKMGVQPSRCKCRMASYGIGSSKLHESKSEQFLVKQIVMRNTHIKQNKVVRRRMA